MLHISHLKGFVLLDFLSSFQISNVLSNKNNTFFLHLSSVIAYFIKIRSIDSPFACKTLTRYTPDCNDATLSWVDFEE